MQQTLIPVIEILVIAVILNYLLSFFWNTRAMDLVKGFIAFLLIFAVASWLRFPVLEKILVNIVNVAVIAVLVIFQPEVRLALSNLGVKRGKYREFEEFDHFLENLTGSVYRLAEKRIGGIILLENQDSLQDYAKKAVVLNARFSSELIESLFAPGTPVHDGALVIRGTTIVSAATILPLADDSSQITKSMGTRHRAALGISQQTDCLSIVISEETGRVSVARDGIMTRGIKQDRFKGIVRSIFNPPQTPTRFSLLEWVKR